MRSANRLRFRKGIPRTFDLEPSTLGWQLHCTPFRVQQCNCRTTVAGQTFLSTSCLRPSWSADSFR